MIKIKKCESEEIIINGALINLPLNAGRCKKYGHKYINFSEREEFKVK
jgi:hypothetical protein